MNRKSKISLYLLFAGAFLFLVLSVLMVWNAYQSVQKQFKFTKQYYLGTAFFQSGMDATKLTPLADTINYMLASQTGNGELNRPVIDSLIKASTREYKRVEDNFEKLLRKEGIHAGFEMAVVVNRFHIRHNDSLIRLYDFENSGSFLTLSGNPQQFNLLRPDNSFFYKLGQFDINIQVAVFVQFPKIEMYLLSQVRYQLLISLIMLLLFVGIVIYTAKTIRKQQIVDQMKTDFINNMTHELKTPLTTLSVAAKTIDPANTNATSSLITSQVKRLESVINRVMELSSLSDKSVNKELIPIKTFFVDIQHTFRDEQTDIQVQFSGVNDDDQMLADRFLLETALLNLLDNARKYGGEDKVLLSVKLDVSWLYISVKDNGKGIPAKYQKYVFNKFYRVPEGNRHEVKGSGLGLFHVAQIVKAHRGRVKLYSSPDQGTEVTLLIPVK